MKKIVYVTVTSLIFIVVAGKAFPQLQVSETGKTGMSFLAISPSSRAASLGGIASGLYTGASSIWSNPSLLAVQKERSAQFTHTEWIEGIKQEYAALSSGVSFGSLGFAVQLFDSGDIELRGESPGPEPLGTYSIKNVAFSFAFARSISDKIAAGLTYKKLFEKISDENAGGYAFDAGIRAETPVKGLSVSAVARNYGRMGKLKNERTELPSDISVGCLYSGIVPGVERSFSTIADIVFPKYGDNGIRLGAEIEPIDRFLFRIGYRSDSDIEDVSFGVGINLERFIADMCYTPMEQGFDNALRFTLSIKGF